MLFLLACTDTQKPGESGIIGHDTANTLPGDSGDPLDQIGRAHV